MDHFPIIRLGNKQRDIKYFKQYLCRAEDIKTMAEPFGGTFAVMRNCYSDCQNLYCGENDDEYLQRLKNRFENVEEYQKFIKNMTEFVKPIAEKNRTINRKKHAEGLKKWIGENAQGLKFDFEELSVRGFLRCPAWSFDYSKLAEMFKRITWLNDYKLVFEMLKNDGEAFLYLDPPYLQSNNKQYTGAEHKDKARKYIDNTGLYIDILELFKVAKCKILMTINKNAINEYLFKPWIVGQYSKLYALSQCREDILLVANYEH